MRFLKQQQRETENKIALASQGFRARTQQKNWRSFIERVQTWKCSLVLGNHTPKKYWLSMSHLRSSIYNIEALWEMNCRN